MIATIIKIDKKPSKFGGHFFYVYFKSDDCKSYYTCLYPKMRSFLRWKNVMKVGNSFTNLKIKEKTLIDADSNFKLLDVKQNEQT